MPIYEYKHTKKKGELCDEVFEVFQRVSAEPLTQCPTCGQCRIFAACRRGLSFMSFLGLFGAYVYAASLGTKFGGPKAVRGLIFGLILAVMMVWIVPLTVTAMGVATGDARTVYQGPGESSGYAATQGQIKTKDHSVGDAPPLGDVRPPLAELTAGQKWTAASDWQGRILPFFAGFLLYGLVLGLILSEDPHK